MSQRRGPGFEELRQAAKPRQRLRVSSSALLTGTLVPQGFPLGWPWTPGVVKIWSPPSSSSHWGGRHLFRAQPSIQGLAWLGLWVLRLQSAPLDSHRRGVTEPLHWPLPRGARPHLRAHEAHRESGAHPGPCPGILRSWAHPNRFLIGVRYRESPGPPPRHACPCSRPQFPPQACQSPSRLGICQVGVTLPSPCPMGVPHSARLPTLQSDSQGQTHSAVPGAGGRGLLHTPFGCSPTLRRAAPSRAHPKSHASEISKMGLSPGHQKQRTASVRMGGQVSMALGEGPGSPSAEPH